MECPIRHFVLSAVSPIAASAADLTVKVVDPQSASVSGAQVLLSNALQVTVRSATSSAEGEVTFSNVSAGAWQIQVLAPGFAPATISVPESNNGPVTVHLTLAAASETVVVTATRTPVPADTTGASISTLEQRKSRDDAARRHLRRAPLSPRRRRQQLRSTWWLNLALRSRRRLRLQQSDRRWSARQPNRVGFSISAQYLSPKPIVSNSCAARRVRSTAATR